MSCLEEIENENLLCEIARSYAETVPFRKIFTPGNQVKLRYFFQCWIRNTISKNVRFIFTEFSRLFET